MEKHHGEMSFTPAKASPQMGTAKAVIGDKDSKDKKSMEVVNLKLSIFFDGTYNNKDNVEARECYERLVGNGGQEKYKAAYSNSTDDKRA